MNLWRRAVVFRLFINQVTLSFELYPLFFLSLSTFMESLYSFFLSSTIFIRLSFPLILSVCACVCPLLSCTIIFVFLRVKYISVSLAFTAQTLCFGTILLIWQCKYFFLMLLPSLADLLFIVVQKSFFICMLTLRSWWSWILILCTG